MKPPAAPSKIYSPPGYVAAFFLAGLLCVLGGAIVLAIALSEGSPPTLAIGLLVTGAINFLYGQIADAIARTNWRVDLLAHQLQPVIDEINYQADEREKAERAARHAQEAEIQRVLQEREAAQG